MKKYHIAMVIARFPPTIGGTEIQCRELSRALSQKGHSVSILTERYDAALPAQENQDGMTLYRLPAGGSPILSSLRFGWHMGRWLRQHPDVDLLHAHMLAGPAMAAFVVGGLLHKPVVLKIAGAGVTGDIGTSRLALRGRFKLWLFKKWARWIACPSLRTYQEIEELGVPKTSLRLIPNGVRTDRFQPLPDGAKTALRSSLKINEADRVALYVGRWAPGKGLDVLLSAWEKAQTRSDFHWKLILVIGQPPPADQQIRLRRLETSVRVAIGVADPLPYYQASDLAVLLSDNEGLSNFLLEAMACGLPSLTSPGAAIGTPAESVGWGWVMPSSNPDDLLAQLDSLQKNPEPFRIKGSVARQKVLDTFSSEKVAGDYERLYSEVLNN